MRRNLYAFIVGLLFVAVSAPLIAQPTFGEGNLPVAGTKIAWNEADTVDAKPQAGGAGVTWDFSKITVGSNFSNLEFVAAADAPHASTFPDATLAEKSDTAWSYYKLDGERWTRLGEVIEQIEGDRWSDPLDFYKLNLGFGESFNDNGAHQFRVQGQDFDRTAFIEGTYDGYGTLILPTGTFTNVMRIKFVQRIHDTTEIQAGPFTIGTGINTEIHAWVWIQENSRIPLLNIDTAYITVVTGGPQPTTNKTVTPHIFVTNQTGQSDVEPPTSLMPENGVSIEGTTVRFTWQRAGANQAVRVQIARDEEFVSVLLDTLVNADELEANALILGERAYWRVRAEDIGEIKKDPDVVQEFSSWSDPRWVLSIPFAPMLVSPEDNQEFQEGQPLDFSWEATTGKSQIQIASDAGFETIVADQEVTGSTYNRNMQLTDVAWRVRAVLPNDVTSNWSEPRTVRVSPLSVNEYEGNGVVVAPNPASDVISVTGDHVSLFNRVELYSVAGQLILQQNVSGQSVMIKTNTIGVGSYVLRLLGDNYVYTLPLQIVR